jgi:acyl-CoA synthetase (NDP forming)
MQPVPRGARVAIVTNAGGPGIMCADACQAYGVEVPELPAGVRAHLAEFLPEAASLGNPIDMIATASAEDYARTIKVLVQTDACDAILAIFVPPLVTKATDVAVAIRGAAVTAGDVAIAAVFMTSEGAPTELSADGVAVPAFEFPEDGARALALAAKHGRWRSRPAGKVRDLVGVHPPEVAAIISAQLAEGGGWLPPGRVADLLRAYKIPSAETRVVADIDAAVQAAADFGRPVALKASASGLVHKKDAGGVLLNLDGADEVRAAARGIEEAVGRQGHVLNALVVQPMSPQGVELIVGVVNDPSFGPVLACGAGGTTAELIKDVAVRITPVTDLDAREMLRSLQTFPLLDGYRGAPACDVGAVEDVIARVSAMVEEHPELVELDLNPLIATPQGVTVVDARVRVEAPPPAVPVPSLDA